MKNHKICLLAVCFTLLNVTCVSISQAKVPVKTQPNIVMIITDDQGWADIGYNNQGKVYTPNLDKLAAEGAVLASHYVMPQCTPTRVAAFTGRYPSRFGGAALKASNAPSFPIGTPTIARMLKSAGYNTYLTGKWHMGSALEHGPNHHGFDSSYGSLAGAVGMYDHRYREGPYYDAWHRDHKLIPGSENGQHATDLIANEAVRVIQQNNSKPYFIMATFHAPHTPLDERGPFIEQPTKLDPANPSRWLNEDKISWFNDPKGLIQKEKDPEKRLLLAAVNHVDHAIGQIMQAIEKSGEKENTIIMFSSDNGPQGSWGGNAYPDDLKLTNFNQALPMKGKKLDVWEGGIHVPAIIHWPTKIQPKVVKQQVHIVDWYPTLASIVDKSNVSVDFDGVDLSPLLFTEETMEQRELYWVWHKKPNRWALRLGDWKLVHYGKSAPNEPSQWQLFNITQDKMEQVNLAKTKPEMLKKLHHIYLEQRKKDKHL